MPDPISHRRRMKRLAFLIALALVAVVVWRIAYRPRHPADVFLGYVEGEILYIGPL